MLELTVHTRHTGDVRLEFEHSLLSVSKWEAQFNKAFLGKGQKTNGELLDYYRLMLTSPEQDPDLVYALTPEQHDILIKYLNSTPGAGVFPPVIGDSSTNRAGGVKTAEVIYSQMTMLRIPWEAERWHINRLMNLIAWISYNQTPEKERKDKRSVREKLTDWASMNEANRKLFNSNG